MMKYTFFTPLFAWVTMLFISTFAAEQKAIVTEPRVNVRGQPTLFSEVVTQLKKGDEVTILELIPVSPDKVKPGEPSNWARIKMPQETPVWVFAPFIKDGKVAVSRLNLRAGPGENYSVVGRLDRNTEVLEIRILEDWMEIQTPDEAYAFIDASLLSSAGGTPLQAQSNTAIPEAAPASAPLPQPTQTPPAQKQQITEETAKRPNELSTSEVSQLPPPDPEPAPLEVGTIEAQPQIAQTRDLTPPPADRLSDPIGTVPPPQSQPSLPQVAPAPPEATPEPPPKRIVRREGIVKSTVSIQAPTYFELVHPETKKTINYLHAAPLGINMKNFRGKRVIVTGEEGLDARWPNVPVIQVESIDTAP